MTQQTHDATKPDQRHSLSSSGSLELLTSLSQQLWRESTFQNLMEKFLDLQRGNATLKAAQLFSLKHNKDECLSLNPHTITLKVPSFNEAMTQTIRKTLAPLNLKSAEARQGLNHLQCGPHSLNFVLLGDPATEWSILLWENETSTQLSMTFAETDFLTRQLQFSCGWFNRLDQTQALLYRDDLTGVFNSRYLEVAVESEIRRSQRFQSSFSVLFLDLDNFKQVNDQYGHLAGSSVLKQFAEVLRDASREVDSIIRYGGDEFVILLLGASRSMAVLAAERIRRRVEAHKFIIEDDTTVTLSASIGVASYPEHATDRESLLKLADEMMYVSKRQGKNRVTLYDPKEQRDPAETSSKELVS